MQVLVSAKVLCWSKNIMLCGELVLCSIVALLKCLFRDLRSKRASLCARCLRVDGTIGVVVKKFSR